MNTAQNKEYEALTSDEQVIYNEAVNCGACHEDAMDAVCCTFPN